MPMEYSIRIIDTNGAFIRTQSVFARDYEMACCMIYASGILAENEFVGGL